MQLLYTLQLFAVVFAACSGCHTRHDGAIVTDIASERHLGSEKINGNEDSFVTDLLKNHLPTSIITCVIQEIKKLSSARKEYLEKRVKFAVQYLKAEIPFQTTCYLFPQVCEPVLQCAHQQAIDISQLHYLLNLRNRQRNPSAIPATTTTTTSTTTTPTPPPTTRSSTSNLMSTLQILFYISRIGCYPCSKATCQLYPLSLQQYQCRITSSFIVNGF